MKRPGIVLALLLCATGVAAEDLRLGSDVVPRFQAIQLRLDADKEEYSGSVTVEIEVTQPTNTFQLHAEGQSFERLEIRGVEERIGLRAAPAEGGVVTVTTERPLEPGSYTLEIDFTTAFNTQAVGLYRMEQDGQGYLFTQFEAIDARKAFPCWDEPRFKIPYRMTLEVPVGHTVVTNTPVERETVADGWKTVVFQETKPMPSYLLAIAGGPLESVPIPGMSIPGRVYTVQGQSHLAGTVVEMTPTILEAMENYFGQPYPYEKLDVIAAPEYWFGGMENPGAIVCDDAAILIDPAAASIRQRRGMAGLMAHEIAHMWFGDLVTMMWWDDLWLNESFATYMGQRITEELYPQYRVDVSRRRGVQWLMSSDARPSTKPVRGEIDSVAAIFEDMGLAYGKGRTVLGMVEQWIGPEAFRQGVMSYLEKHAWGNAVAADLWNALSEASETDVAAPMSSFLDQPGLPLIDVSVEPNGSIKLRQQRFLNHGVRADRQKWSVPVRLRFSDGTTVGRKNVLLDRKSKKLDVGLQPEWVFPDDGAHGYYRWSLPREMLLAIAEHSVERLEPAERIVFLGNAAALLDAGRISGADYLEILNRFAGDPDPEVVSGVVSGLGKVEAAFVPDELRGAFGGYVRATLRPILERFGMSAAEGEDETVSMLRPRLLGWLGDEGEDPVVRGFAAKQSLAYMQDPHSVDPSIAGTLLGIAAIGGDRELYDRFRKSFETAKTPVERRRYLGALGSFSTRDLQEEALGYALGESVRPDEMFSITGGVAKTEADRDWVFLWMTNHYEELTSRVPRMMAAFLPYSAGGCSTERLEMGRAFFADPAHKVPGTDRNLAKVGDSVSDCANLRAREGAAVAAYLKQFEEGG